MGAGCFSRGKARPRVCTFRRGKARPRSCFIPRAEKINPRRGPTHAPRRDPLPAPQPRRPLPSLPTRAAGPLSGCRAARSARLRSHRPRRPLRPGSRTADPPPAPPAPCLLPHRPPGKTGFFLLTHPGRCAIISKLNQYRGVEQLVARRAHNPEVVGSNPSPATTKKTDFVKKSVFFCAFSETPYFFQFLLGGSWKNSESRIFNDHHRQTQDFV